jgi:hypothetical protein
MNSRRLNVAPEAQDNAAYQVEFAMSALDHKRTHAVQQVMSALPPIATEKADITAAQLGDRWCVRDRVVSGYEVVSRRSRPDAFFTSVEK